MNWDRFGQAMLALLAWREARGESDEAIAAVVHSVLNRVANPKWWGTNLVDVIGKKWQYSSLTDPRDRQLTLFPKYGDASFVRCMRIVSGVVDGIINNPMPGADSYYDTSIPPPKWATDNLKVGTIGRLVFFNIDRDSEV